MTTLWRLLRDRRAMTATETAIVAPTLIVMALGATDVAMGFAQKMRIQQASSRAIEMATAGAGGAASLTGIQNEAASAAGVASSAVVVDRWLECDGVRQATYGPSCPTSGAQLARYVAVTVNGGYVPMFSMLLPRPGGNGVFPIQGYASVRIQ